MESSPALRLNALRPAISARWIGLLRTAPQSPAATRAVVTPAMLEFLVDDTLRQMVRRLDASTAPLPRHHLLPFGPRRAGCQCGLHLLLTYYLTGAQAIRETLPADLGLTRVEIIRCLNDLAHDEMMGLCGLCHYRDGALCTLRPVPAAVPRRRRKPKSPPS